MSAPAGTPVVFARTLRAEWDRLWTVRSTWVVTAAATLGVLGLCVLVGLDSRGPGQTEPGETVWVAVRTTSLLLLLPLLALAAASTTADHATGGIVPTLQWTPRRLVLLAARCLVVTATVAALGLVLAVLAAVLLHRLAPVLALPWGEGLSTLATLLLVDVLAGVLAVGLGLLLRSTAGAVVAVLGLVLVLPLLLGNLPFDLAEELARLLPGSGVLRLVTADAFSEVSAATARWTLAAWSVAALLAGGWRLVRSDANG